MRGYLHHSWLVSLHNYSLTRDLGDSCVETLITYVKTQEVLGCWSTNAQVPGKPASKAQFPSPLLFLWTQLSEKSTWNIVQHVFLWTRIECRKETICILKILFCRKSMCQENGTYVLNEFRQSCTFAVLFKKKSHLLYQSETDMGFSSAFNQNWNTNTKYKMTVQHSWFTMAHQVLENDLAEAKHPPSSTQQTPVWTSKQVLAGQKAVWGKRLIEQCTPAPCWDRQPTAAFLLCSLVGDPLGMSSPGASGADLCKNHLKE